MTDDSFKFAIVLALGVIAVSIYSLASVMISVRLDRLENLRKADE